MRTCGFVVLGLIVGAGIATAASLSLWPGEFDTPQPGGRFRDEHAVWPGLYWRGQGLPPVAARLEDPATWGLLRLGGKLEAAPPVEATITELTAPLLDERPMPDGLFGYGEWAQAAAAVEPLAEGQSWLVFAAHTADTLYVCVVSPSQLVLRKGQTAELCLAEAAADGHPLAGTGRQWRVRADREQRAELQSASLRAGVWYDDPLAKGQPAPWRGGATGRGDGAWGFAVFEFAVPLAESKARSATPEQFRLMIRLQTSDRGDIVGDVKNTNPESVVWPDSRTSWTSVSRTPVGLRPDSWRPLHFDTATPGEGSLVPGTSRPIRIDGQIGLKEWSDASCATYALPGDQRRQVWLMRDATHLYVAVKAHLARGLRQAEACRAYVDPVGDGGMQPRGDDLQLRLPLGPESTLEVLRAQNGAWQPGGALEAQGASYPMSTYDSAYEFALPLKALGPDLHPALAVEVVYGLER